MFSRPTLTAALAAALAVPALALAGRTVVDGTDTLKISGSVKPAKASESKSRPRAVAFKVNYSAGTTDGSNVADVRSGSVFGGGGVTNYDAFPKCAELKLRDKGPSACPKGSRVGKGTATAELHIPGAAEKEDVTLKVKVFNGKIQTNRNARRYKKPRDGLLFFTTFLDGKHAFPFEAEDGNTRVTYYNPKKDPETPGDNALYTVKEVHLTFPRRVRRGIPWIQAPTKCPSSRKWVGTVTVDRYDGGKMTAKHAVRCSPA
jgi:hypothetical protein